MQGSETPPAKLRATAVLLTVIVIVSAAVRFWALGFGLPHTNTRPDETIIIDVALSFLRGNFRPAFFDYPWLYMWMTSGLYLVYYADGAISGVFQSLPEFVASWKVHWTPFFMIPRALSATLGTATVLVVFRIARRLWDDHTAVVAALFMGLAFLHVRDSHYGTTDVTMTFFLMLSLSFLFVGHLEGSRRAFVIGGLAGGLAAATKYNALLLIVPLTASYLLHIVEAGDGRARALRDPRLLLYGVPFLLTFAIGVPFVAYDLPRVLADMRLLNASMQVGSNEPGMSAGWMHHIEYSLRYGIGLPMLVASFLGMLLMLWREPRIAALLLSFPIAYYLVAGSVQNLFFRYMIAVVPFLCLAAARLVTWAVPALLHGAGFGSGASSPKWRALPAALVSLAALAIVLPPATSSVRWDRFMARTDNRVVVARWFDGNVPAGSSVMMSGSAFGYVQFTRAMGYQAWVWDRHRRIFVTDLDRRPTVGRPEWILVQDSPLPNETQPAVLDLLNEGYALTQYFPAFSRTSEHIFDQQDAFFAPFAGFDGVERPGPNYSLYKRLGAP